MLTQNENLFANAISIEKLASRLELAASKVHGTISGSGTTGGTYTVTVGLNF